MNPAIEQAYDAAGGRRKVIESLGVSKQTLSDWIRADSVSPKHAAKLEALSGVSRRLLCPEFDWGPEPARTVRAKATAPNP